MNQLNSLILEGNVTRKPEVKETNRGFSVCNISIAVNRYYKNSTGEATSEVSYFDIETYGKLAEFCANYADKGRGLRVVGRIKQSRWIGSDGKNTSRVTIIAEHIELKPQIKKEPSDITKQEIADLSEAASAAQAENADIL